MVEMSYIINNGMEVLGPGIIDVTLLGHLSEE